jgi:hypothetical protein
MNTADIRPYAIAVCGLALSVSVAAAAEIKSFNLKDDSVEISISGKIAPGDIDALRASIKAANDARSPIFPGGIKRQGQSPFNSAQTVKSHLAATLIGKPALGQRRSRQNGVYSVGFLYQCLQLASLW